jgi:glycosyltransferase involved in cell wall biosynthesis
MCSKSLPFIYDMSFELYSQYTDPRNQVFLSQQVALSTKRATYIVTISENAKSEIAAFYNFDQSKIGVYYPSVDTSHFYKRSSLEVKAVQKKYALPSRYMLFIGNIEPRKNLKNLLLAYATLPKPIRSSLPLVLVGANGWQNDEIFELISELRRQGNSIIMPDKYVIDADLPAVYTGATLFVYPSEYEGFGIPPLEAMACGVPVILASNSSLPEAAGDAALYVDALSVNEISAAITKLSANTKLMSDFRKKGYQQIKKFSWDKSAVKLLADIEEL